MLVGNILETGSVVYLFARRMTGITGQHSYFYFAYGLRISSDILLNDLVAASSGGDVAIGIRELESSYLESEFRNAAVFERPGCAVRVSKNAICYDWSGLGKALVRNGNEVFLDPIRGVDGGEFSPFVTGAILAILLHQRGLLVLHASAVVVDGRAIAFLGNKGAGKSTLAAFLQKRGHGFLTDDLVPIAFEHGTVKIAPGFPRIKLRADSVKSVDLEWDAMAKVHPLVDKRSHRILENFSHIPVSLSGIYVLEKSPEINIVQQSSTAALTEIVRHTFLGKYLQTLGQIGEHFQHCSRLVSAVPVYRLKRPHIHSFLPALAETIERHNRES